jgi:hypothetical protein
LIAQVSRTVHDRKYPGTSASCTICREFAEVAVDAVLESLQVAEINT